MPAPHCALSEALIVLVGLWVVFQLTRRGMWFGALGIAIFSAAAAIGVTRFGFGQIEELAPIHQTLSQVGGATAMALVAMQLVMAPGKSWTGWRLTVAIALAVVTLVSGMIAREATVPLFTVWLLIAIIASAAWPAPSVVQRLLRAAVVAIFLANLLFVRQSSILSADTSWHLFHILIAAWLVGIWWLLKKHAFSND
ncbi:MAG: hypothetical protein AAFQ64_21105 [Pseudomonadota bacterium]